MIRLAMTSILSCLPLQTQLAPITGALLNHVKEFAAKFFDVQVKIGVPRYEGDFADIVCNPKFSTAVGALYFANDFMLYNKYANEFKSIVDQDSALSKIKNFFKNM